MTERLELKAQFTADEVGTVKGIAWPWSPDSVGDEIAPGAFDGLALPLPMFSEHAPTAVGAWTHAEQKADGLYVTGRLFVPSLARANDVYARVKAGQVTGLSIGFVTRKATSRQGGGRRIEALDLSEISLCRRPVHRGARITHKSAAALVADAIMQAAAALKK